MSVSVRVHIVDPSAYTPPYDHALSGALAREGAQVELITSAFAYGALPPPDGYARRELFYRAAASRANPAVRRAVKLATHVPEPTSICALSAGAFLLTLRRRRN